ncbi:hypothetical protein GOBAR_AA34019 [Gossypium barbadense]|uniref:PAR1 protein n=1 Tax=Gossypium barbadense TaxID=3634 RepID=A0A2P5W6F8_GOSBA|nr:hypothetical protein GOBAR_AA34019 [Gossypium barbadense]
MASSMIKLNSLFVTSEIICEDLPKDVCAFSIATSGKRCLLETSVKKDGYECRTSEVVVVSLADYIESDECVRACGVDRTSTGFSSDSLLEPQFTAKLCSPACYQYCPNIVDLYFNLAAGEGMEVNVYSTRVGVLLADLCEAQRTDPRRTLMELLSSGAAPGPVSSESGSLFGVTPASAPL